ncbi:MAG: hypothetical protein NDI61_06850 [Bdellovibrionaceae bacterium]|nr:hypothetical protein [Pseudobdellovibrionaceae bacterium]
MAVSAPSLALARKFDFKNESIATYLKGTWGPSAVARTPFGDSSGASTATFDQRINSNYSGEFGLVLSTTYFNLRVAAELLLPSHISDVKGKDASGSILFNLDTKTSAVIPTVYLDFVGLRTVTSKAYVGAGLGYGYVKLENIYSLTATGTSTYPGQTDFTEKAEGQAIVSHLYAGYETLLADNATIVFDLGYRYFTANDLTHLNTASTFLGSVTRGDRVRKADGTARSIDLGGGYAGLALRFYIAL